ncbi:MAG: hypothetical protein V4726_21115 [Verrucomicrobiota bacterium]
MNARDIHDKAASTLSISSVEYQLGYKEALNAAAHAASADGIDLSGQSPAFAALRELALKNWATPVPPGADFAGGLADEG